MLLCLFTTQLQNRFSSSKSCKSFPAGWGFSVFQFSDGGLNKIINGKNKKLTKKAACEIQGIFEQTNKNVRLVMALFLRILLYFGMVSAS